MLKRQETNERNSHQIFDTSINHTTMQINKLQSRLYLFLLSWSLLKSIKSKLTSRTGQALTQTPRVSNHETILCHPRSVASLTAALPTLRRCYSVQWCSRGLDPMRQLSNEWQRGPSKACCDGVSTLSSAASTADDRRAACSCIMSAVSKVKPNTAAAQALPGSCNITLPFTVSPDLDCSKYERRSTEY